MRILALLLLLIAAAAGAADTTGPAHGIAMHGDLKYGPGFAHFDYVNPEAPKGGTLRLAGVGTYDSFNPFIIKGVPDDGSPRIYDTLMVGSADEPFSEYGLLAETIETPPDRSWVIFRLRKEARWHDGKPVTADDVLWSYETLRSKGQPFYRAYYANVDKAEKLDDRSVRFTFKAGENRELPLIMGQLAVLPKHYWEGRDFEASTLDPPLGSGPYKIGTFEAGRWSTYDRVPDYWGRDLAVNVGRNNIDVVRYDYYRDMTVALEAVKAGAYDLHPEASSKEWATAYDIPAVRDGRLIKGEFKNDVPSGMQGYAFNLRRPLFQDRRVRQALGYALDFEWSNRTLFYGQYTRARSYFDNSELAANGVPQGAELQVLEPFRGKVPDEVFTTEYQPPTTDGSGNLRDNLRKAAELLKAAGWTIDSGTKKLVNAQGQPFEFEILLLDPVYERVTLPFVKNLERLGVTAKVRTVDTSQFKKRMDDFDFDMVIERWLQALSPGNEQRSYWGSASADQQGSRNTLGLKDPTVDALIEQIIAAPDRASLVARVHALDRVLQWGFYVVPNWYIAYDRIAYWDKFGQPAVTPMQGVQLDTWWVDPAKDAALQQRRGR
ncbi:MAG TPA: extracellular solute-binding protein [Candidatus Dormibacteraeota bacterium]|nr:extracellular solute-binding protein [Candidatus Dormibacteraeota bacterium]